MLGALVYPRATPALVREHVPAGAKVIAVDGGADACLAADLVPAIVVGDMDSVHPETLAVLAKRGARIERHPSAKRDTDAALALVHARECDEVLFVGAGGGRADHALANLHLLAKVAQHAAARAVDEDSETWVVTADRPLQLELPIGTVLSAIPFDATVEGVTYEGLAYPLEGATMLSGDPYGVSNAATGAMQRIQVSRGRLLVIRPIWSRQGIS